jgi:hypothetical protein
MRLSKKAGDFWVSHLTDKVFTLATGEMGFNDLRCKQSWTVLVRFGLDGMRIDGPVAASQIAAASLASFIATFAKPFTLA